jgi:2-polyprenyl-3-methyl-5-hydroxy-6-metoxy-1,4-benzoquinol methylase
MPTPSTSPELSQGEWPAGGLENVPCCPVCGAVQRALIHAKLRDRVYRCAPGEWDIYECGGCRSGYLDPRPSPDTIALAYRKYCTHAPIGVVDYARASPWRRFRIAQRNAYLNASYGYHLKPAAWSPIFLSATRRRRFDTFTGFFQFPGPGARALDIGSGNGSFLWQLRSLGWEVCGVEPDPQSAAHARAAGLDVHDGLLQQQSFPDAHFHAIAMTHVIEHLHDPMDTLRRCWKLLKPGGQITVATPNLGSRGHRILGANWFALMPPTHLVLFTENSLRLALEKCGFVVSRPPLPGLKAREYFKNSYKLVLAESVRQNGGRLPWPARIQVAKLAASADAATRKNPALTEELILLGKKPL